MKLLPTLILLHLAAPAMAGAPRITEVEATKTDSGVKFDVTIKHGDTGWDHYADGWTVTTTDGKSLGYRKLFHPHVDEQPFTRSLTTKIPDGITEVLIIANDSVHGEGRPFLVQLPE